MGIDAEYRHLVGRVNPLSKRVLHLVQKPEDVARQRAAARGTKMCAYVLAAPLRQRLPEIGDQIVDMFQPDRDP